VRVGIDTRAGEYECGLQTKAGEVRLRVPKLRWQTFETAIIERYREIFSTRRRTRLAGARSSSISRNAG
jgi:transposase-like protein